MTATLVNSKRSRQPGISRVLKPVLRYYPFPALVTAAALTPLETAWGPIVLLLGYIYLHLPKRNRPLWTRVNLAVDLLVIATIAVYLYAPLGEPALLLVLPLLGTLAFDLESAARESNRPAGETPRLQLSYLSWMLVTWGVVTALVAVILTNLALLYAALLVLAGTTALILLLLWRARAPFIHTLPQSLRVVAGTERETALTLLRLGRLAGKVWLTSPETWLRVKENDLDFTGRRELTLSLRATPPLSGPQRLDLTSILRDRWGLMEIPCRVEALRLTVIPRGQYAAWIARRYLNGTAPGSLDIGSLGGALRSLQPTRVGIDYYGSRMYQPGDSMKLIDWKHTAKLRKYVAKEFADPKGRAALVLVNLSAVDAEDADKLAFKIIATGLTLAQERIPAALAAYDHTKVQLNSGLLSSRALVLKTLELAARVQLWDAPARGLDPPDALRLLTDLHRLDQVEGTTARVLHQLIEMELHTMRKDAHANPATVALIQSENATPAETNLVVVSQRNHDAAALSLRTAELKARGMGIIEV